VVNGHKSAAHVDSPDGGTSKTCLDAIKACLTSAAIKLMEVCTVPVLLVYVMYCKYRPNAHSL